MAPPETHDVSPLLSPGCTHRLRAEARRGCPSLLSTLLARQLKLHSVIPSESLRKPREALERAPRELLWPCSRVAATVSVNCVLFADIPNPSAAREHGQKGRPRGMKTPMLKRCY